MNDWTASLPIYVTRSHGGETAAYSAPAWFGVLATALVMLNVVLWGIVGIVTAVGVLL